MLLTLTTISDVKEYRRIKDALDARNIRVRVTDIAGVVTIKVNKCYHALAERIINEVKTNNDAEVS